MNKPRPQLGRGFHVINQRQQAWARKAGVPLTSNHTLGTLEENLFRPLRPKTRIEFELADGKELNGKLRKLHSSAALVLNVFDHLRERPEIVGACFSAPEAVSINFETKHSIFDGLLPRASGSKDPNFDLEIQAAGSLTNIAVECKFTEPFVRYEPTRPAFSKTYFAARAEVIWRGMDRTRALATELNNEASLFTRLDAPQLIKTALACNRAFPKGRWCLAHVRFDVPDDPLAADECRVLADDLSRFREQTFGEIALQVLTWQQVFERLRQHLAPTDAAYIAYIEQRYFQSV